MLCCPTILDQAEGTHRPIYKAEEMPMSQSDTGWFCRKSCFCILEYIEYQHFLLMDRTITKCCPLIFN